MSQMMNYDGGVLDGLTVVLWEENLIRQHDDDEAWDANPNKRHADVRLPENTQDPGMTSLFFTYKMVAYLVHI